jgi:hypothetical protein
MFRVPCAVLGCQSAFETNETVKADATFICRHHPREVQLDALGRRSLCGQNRNEDMEAHFQSFQFDTDLDSATDPLLYEFGASQVRRNSCKSNIEKEELPADIFE